MLVSSRDDGNFNPRKPYVANIVMLKYLLRSLPDFTVANRYRFPSSFTNFRLSSLHMQHHTVMYPASKFNVFVVYLALFFLSYSLALECHYFDFITNNFQHLMLDVLWITSIFYSDGFFLS